jgi:hypothetical protein
MTGAFLHALAPLSAASRLFERCLKLDFTKAHLCLPVSEKPNQEKRYHREQTDCKRSIFGTGIERCRCA